MINDGLRERHLSFRIVMTSDRSECPVPVTGLRATNDNDDEVVKSVIFGADQYSGNWGLKNFLVFSGVGGQYKEGIQRKIREQRPDFSWFFPADPPKYWKDDEEGEEAVVFNAEWLAKWLSTNGHVIQEPLRPTQRP